MLRPKNLFEPAPGRGFQIFKTDKNIRVGVLNLMGNVFMKKCEDVFETSKKFLSEFNLKDDYDLLVVDFHGEITSEKNAIGHFFDGHTTLVVGTHTHIPTNDAKNTKQWHRIPNRRWNVWGLRFCNWYGQRNSLNRFLKKDSVKHFPSVGEGSLSGVIVDCDINTGLAKNINSYIFGDKLKIFNLDMAGHSHWAGIKHKKEKPTSNVQKFSQSCLKKLQ